MAFDFTKVKSKRKGARAVDPIEIFQKLKVTDPGINDLWLAQGDALRQWHDFRLKPDIGVVLNTGAGKTLVGLLIAQSLVNETKDKILYACSSIQLVEQTAEKAQGYGLGVTTYFRGKYSNDLFARGEAPCITTYQALFNGRSIFFNQQIAAVIFDDAHAAEHLLRDHFSLRIERSAFPGIYEELIALFRVYHEQAGKSASYRELKDTECNKIFLVPPFEILTNQREIERILNSAKFQETQSTTFAWEHIKDYVNTCCILITGANITITPPFVPVLTLPYFSEDIRRIYLSATLSAPDAFARTFGRIPNEVVAPSTSAGECERLILIPSQSNITQEDTQSAKQIIDNRKALILVPTYARSSKWHGVSEPPPREHVSEHVTAFRDSNDKDKLLLAARYDGVDLPGDTCRVMVIDDLPMGVGTLERFLWENLGLANTLRTAIASRIVQSFGRISRGMSDHGIVLLTGRRLVEWVLIPKNRSVLPAFLQKQIDLGDAVSNEANSVDDLNMAADQCLARDEGWINTYDEFMADAEPELSDVDEDLLTRLAQSEARFAEAVWQHEHHDAVRILSTTLEDAFSLSTSTGAWHCLWLGSAYLNSGDEKSAEEMFARAHGSQRNIPAYPRKTEQIQDVDIPNQIVAVDQQITINADSTVSIPKGLHTDLVHLNGTGTSPQTEEALRALGQYLGFQASRPDKEYGTGPDVLWVQDGLPALCIEAKTDKTHTSRYQKKEVGQLTDHVQWVKDNLDIQDIIPIFVGPAVSVTNTANPPDEQLVIELDQFNALSESLIAAINDAANVALPLTLINTLYQIFNERTLLWPDVFNTLEKHHLKDL
ncbi:MAG: DEAD/DEAH box helicase family protein [Candidatus Thiodiazotropha endolucinida]